LLQTSTSRSDRPNLFGLLTPRALGGLELNALTLVERLVAGRLDRTEVDEHIRAATIDCDEAVARSARRVT
jgi:hypothetical protein